MLQLKSLLQADLDARLVFVGDKQISSGIQLKSGDSSHSSGIGGGISIEAGSGKFGAFVNVAGLQNVRAPLCWHLPGALVGGNVTMNGGTDGGFVKLHGGSASTKSGGSIEIESGTVSSAWSSGDVRLQSANSKSKGGTGDVSLHSGHTQSRQSGHVHIFTGTAFAGASGDIRVEVFLTFGCDGKLLFVLQPISSPHWCGCI